MNLIETRRFARELHTQRRIKTRIAEAWHKAHCPVCSDSGLRIGVVSGESLLRDLLGGLVPTEPEAPHGQRH